MSTQATTRKVFYVLSTHWDREWYQSFQHYRHRLVQLMDRILDGIRDGRMKGPFQMDGQAIILEDYLEIRPERREEVTSYVRERKLVVGPWYVLPDEFLISGESHIRNIRLGRQIARDFGAEPSKAGFVCDLFGHISQMPQIFAGFGITNAFMWRGLNLDTKRHLLWTGADGTTVTCYKFANIGYCDYAFKVRDAEKFGVKFDKDDKTAKLDKYLDFEASETDMGPVLMFDGGDHQEWDQRVYDIMGARIGTTDDRYSYEHTSLDEYVDAMLAERDSIETHLVGELREPGRTPGKGSHQIHGVLSSRVWIKQANQELQNALCHWVEPLTSFVDVALGLAYPKGYLDVAWKHLIQNHPHDSICGCSIDQVHEDMKYRFSQCRQIAERLVLDATQKIAANIEGQIEEKELRVTVFNPMPVAHSGPTDLVLDIPGDYPTFGEFFGFEQKPMFTIYDEAGTELPFQRNGQTNSRIRARLWVTKFPENYRVTEVKVSLPLEIPANGYTTLTIRPGIVNEPIRYPQDKGLATSERGMENSRLAVRIESNGTLTVTDKKSGDVYTDLLTFENRADIGDGWFHGIAINDQIMVSSAAQSDVALIENGPNTTAFRIRTTMRVPEEFDLATMRRSERRVELHFDSIVRLRAGADHLEVETTIDNNAGDHRVRVMFPSGANATTFFTDTPFDVVERNIALREDNHAHFELEVETRPQQSWCAVFDGKRGMAVIATGLMETGVRDLENQPIALTLFRATRRTVNTDGEPEGQLRGKMTFRYLVKPLSNAPDRTELFLDAMRLATGLRMAQMRREDQELHYVSGGLPSTGGFFGLEGHAVLTSSRFVDDGFEVRVFNPGDAKISSSLKFATGKDRFKKAEYVDFESKPAGGALAVKAGTVSFDLEPKQIRTIRLGV